MPSTRVQRLGSPHVQSSKPTQTIQPPRGCRIGGTHEPARSGSDGSKREDGLQESRVNDQRAGGPSQSLSRLLRRAARRAANAGLQCGRTIGHRGDSSGATGNLGRFAGNDGEEQFGDPGVASVLTRPLQLKQVEASLRVGSNHKFKKITKRAEPGVFQ
jgi:hypothetical protein